MGVEAVQARRVSRRHGAATSSARWRATWPGMLAGMLAALVLSACGGGGSDPGDRQGALPANSQGYDDPPLQAQNASDVVPSDAEAARFLTQATFGPNMEGIAELRQIGYSNWLNRQFRRPGMDSHWAYVARKGPTGCGVCDAQSNNNTMESFWLQAVQGPDQLRQRTVLALSEIFVVSTINSDVGDAEAYASYLDMLGANAFGNFRDLLEAVTRSPLMGHYLSHIRNQKEDPKSGRTPDENFAREVMQLFTIGLWEIDDRGQRKKDASNQDIPTYDLDDVMGLARVLTGLSWAAADQSNDAWWGGKGKPWNLPMQMYPQFHSSGAKAFLSASIPATTVKMTQAMADADLKLALDTLFKHPNVPAFIGRQLIKRLVTSNPSPDYVWRVAQAFKDNGQGVRGDMKAVIRAVLLDPEARDATKAADPNWGKLREPILRYAHYMRAFHNRASGGLYRVWSLDDPVWGLGQNILHAPSVFNWFSPDYSPPGELLDANLSAPEFQITHETTLTGYSNFIADRIWFGNPKFANDKLETLLSNYEAEIALAGDPDKLLDRLDILLMNGQLSTASRVLIKDTLSRITGKAGKLSKEELRVHMAIRLLMTSPEYLVQK